MDHTKAAPGKTQVLVLYGGRSTEHEISCRSAAFVLRNLDKKKYDVRAVAIDKDGRWLPQDVPALLSDLKGPVPIHIPHSAASLAAAPTDPAMTLLSAASGSGAQRNLEAIEKNRLVVFPVLHGTFGEDGSIQGMFDLAEVAYVGPDTLGSAVGMDKAISKRLAQAAGVPVVPWVETRKVFWEKHAEEILDEAVKELGFPMFVKPARLGSSVGINKVKDRAALKKACVEALSFDDKILIEQGLDVREIEIAVLGDYDPIMSVPGEVIPHAEFYTYEAKYIDAEGASMAIPAKIDAAQTKRAKDLAKLVFQALDLYGMARIDLFLDKKTNEFFFNEVNTIPGFTEISQYPLLWKESGVGAAELLDRLVALAIARQETRAGLKRSK